MDPFVLYSIASVAVLNISIYLIFFIFKGKLPSNLPPGSTGWPILGENLDMAVSPERFIFKRIEKHSPSHVFQTSIAGERMAVFSGANGNKLLFSNENKLVTTWWPKSIIEPVFRPTDCHNTFRKGLLINRSFTVQILKPENLKQYIPTMDIMAREHIKQQWLPFNQVKAFPLSKEYTFALACKLFLSIEGYEKVKRLSDPFTLITSGVFSIPVNLPGTRYNRAMKGGKMVRDELVRLIKERKKQMAEKKEYHYNDLLSRLMSSTDENGRFMNDVEICNAVVGSLFASYDTTSAAITFILKYLSELPHIYDGVYKEQMDIAKSKAPEELLNWDDIRKMKYSWNVACETLRLLPPAQGAFREAITDFTFDGYTIPKGWKIFWSVFSTHKSSKYFSEPEKFNPSRFEGDGPAPHTFVPFGGGPRICPGKEYARLQILVFIHNVVTKFKLNKLIPNEEILYHGSPRPVKGLPISIQPHT